MFENIDALMTEAPEAGLIKNMMFESLPVIYNALYPSGASLLEDTKIQIRELKEELKENLSKNRETVLKQRELFRYMLRRLKEMGNKYKILE